MSRLETAFHHLANLLVGGTGLAYAAFLYLVPRDPFGGVHPLQPQVQHLHVLLAPLLVFSAGALWKRHAWERWRQGFPTRRRTGLGLMLNFWPMAASGYLIQVAVDEGWRRVWVSVHLAASALWILAYAAHQWLARAPAAAAPAAAPDRATQKDSSAQPGSESRCSGRPSSPYSSRK